MMPQTPLKAQAYSNQPLVPELNQPPANNAQSNEAQSNEGQSGMSSAEQVVLLDAAYQPIGTQDKATVHTTETPLHLAFSCYILDASGNLVLTRRALEKVAWPGVWTNSVCGHISPGEAAEDAVARRVAFELGLDQSLQTRPVCVLEDFEYRAVDDSGIVEWEFCPVFIMQLSQPVQWQPNPAEVANLVSYPVEKVLAAVEATPEVFSPWMVLQLSQEGLVQALREVSAQ